MLLILLVISLLFWCIILLLPWRPWSTKESFDRCNGHIPLSSLDTLTVLIPARNEAPQLGKILPSILSQGTGITVLVVDDCSDDETAEVATKILDSQGVVIKGKPLQEGWVGKLWALEQGLKHVKTKYILLMDADIVLERGILSSVLSFMEKKDIDFFSLMAWLNMEYFLERLFMPAFVYFFKLLYPFKLANKKGNFVAAAAGGFILTKTEILKNIGAFSTLKGSIIDDCTLAQKVKDRGYTTFVGLTKCVKSIRKYQNLATIWHMVERTAYTQLLYNPFLLILATFLLVTCFIVPTVGLFSCNLLTLVISLTTLFIMYISYVPVLRYYDLNPLIGVTLPFVASLYLAMTWSSAVRYYLGVGAAWKGRKYINKSKDK